MLDYSLIIGFAFVFTVLLIEGKTNVQKHDWRWSNKTLDLTSWYQPWEICMLQNDSDVLSLQIIRKECIEKSKPVDGVESLECRAGGNMQRTLENVGCRLPSERSMLSHTYLRKHIEGFDNPAQDFVGQLVKNLHLYDAAFITHGDSVSSHAIKRAVNCELDRKGYQFSSVDFVRGLNLLPKDTTVKQNNTEIVLRFYINLHLDLKAIEESLVVPLSEKKNILLLLNTGLHYSDPHIFENHVRNVFTFLDQLSYKHNSTRFVFVWMETSAQHFHGPTSYGYWAQQSQDCGPIKDLNSTLDWRNYLVAKVLETESLFKLANTYFSVLPIRKITETMWDTHDGAIEGSRRGSDCTHYCWSPLYFQPIFSAIAESSSFFS